MEENVWNTQWTAVTRMTDDVDGGGVGEGWMGSDYDEDDLMGIVMATIFSWIVIGIQIQIAIKNAFCGGESNGGYFCIRFPRERHSDWNELNCSNASA